VHAVQDAFPSAWVRGVAQKADLVRRPLRSAACAAAPGRVAADASADRDAGRSGANLERCQASVRDCPWAKDLDSLWAEVGQQQVLRQRRVAPERRQVRPLQDVQWMAARPCGRQAVLRKAVPQAMPDELAFPQGRVVLRQVSPPREPQA